MRSWVGSAKFLNLWLPEYVRRPLCPVTVVCGPPGSGKNYYINQHKNADDVVIDLDEIKAELSGLPLYHAGKEVLNAALIERNRRIDALADRTIGRAWLIAGCPSIRDRRFWREKLNAEIVVLESSQGTCINRINKDNSRPFWNRYGFLSGVRSWWRNYQRDPADVVILEDSH